VDLAANWARELRPDLRFESRALDVMDPQAQREVEDFAGQCDVGICAVDDERAKFHFDFLMRKFAKPWTLGEVLSGGIGGWAHRFVPGGPCYGGVAGHLQREVREAEPTPPPDYSSPQAPETSIPASKASIAVIAALHANVTLELLDGIATPLDVLL